MLEAGDQFFSFLFYIFLRLRLANKTNPRRLGVRYIFLRLRLANKTIPLNRGHCENKRVSIYNNVEVTSSQQDESSFFAVIKNDPSIYFCT